MTNRVLFKQAGLSLIELIAFIVIMGLISTGILTGMNHVLRHIAEPQRQLQASYLGYARANAVLAQRVNSGVIGLVDPCTLGIPADMCVTLINFANNANLIPSSTITSLGQVSGIDINVSGMADATLQTEISNYEGN